jgi:diaminohydroxyphosphoribosylaminopyrimidine deaminase/5-amino-6-(5-phosphoribosylamino)uracil reductase
MLRCIELAQKGEGYVAPNPMVGAVLEHHGRIIGEGYHEVYGSAHAEVNCINSVHERDRHLVSASTMYVSLEPCAHFGKTPPCADLIVAQQIPRVVIGCRDPFYEVNGKGIEKLMDAGIHVESGVLEEQCRYLNRRFFIYHQQHRPYILLKWAQTSDGLIGNYGNNRLRITGGYTNRLVHKWRSEEMSIMVGTNTAAMDNPLLTNRLWWGNNPVRLVIDLQLELPASLHLFDGSTRTVVFNLLRHEETSPVFYYQVAEDASIVHQVINALYQLKITSVMIEGGAKLLQSFIDENMWDEARVITNQKLVAGTGVPAPVLQRSIANSTYAFGEDVVREFINGER